MEVVNRLIMDKLWRIAQELKPTNQCVQYTGENKDEIVDFVCKNNQYI